MQDNLSTLDPRIVCLTVSLPFCCTHLATLGRRLVLLFFTNYMYPVKVDVVLIFIFQLFFNEAFSNNFVGLYILVDNSIVFFRTSYGNLSNLSVSSFTVMISHYEPPFFKKQFASKRRFDIAKSTL